MDKDTEREILFAVEATVNKIDGQLEGRFTRVHERIDPLVEDVAGIKAKVSLFPSPSELDEKIDNRVKACRENHDEKDRIRAAAAISKKDWVKIIGMILAAIASAFGINIGLK